MPRNVEIKARVSDLDLVRQKVMSLTSLPSEILEQRDTFFVVSQGRLKIREFSDGSGELISYDRPDKPDPKESVYARCACPDPRLLATALSKVLGVRRTVVKRREVFLVGRTRVHLDHVDGLGSFVELEVVLSEVEPFESGKRDAHNLLRVLEIPETALIATAYIDLLEALPSSSTSAADDGHEPVRCHA